MIDTTHLLPPDLGPRSNPVLHGIAEAIAKLCPLVAHFAPIGDEDATESSTVEPADEASEGAAAVTT